MANINQRSELRVRGIGKVTKEKLRNIAANLGMSQTALVKKHLPQIIDLYDKSLWEKRNGNC